MSLPDWVETAPGLISGLLAIPLAMSRSTRAMAAYVVVRFSCSVADLLGAGLARPLRELGDSQILKIRSKNIAEAATAHNRSVTDRLEAEALIEKANAQTEQIEAETDAIRNKTSIERGRFELEQLERKQALAEKRLAAAKERLQLSLEQLNLKNGTIYLPDDLDEK